MLDQRGCGEILVPIRSGLVTFSHAISNSLALRDSMTIFHLVAKKSSFLQNDLKDSLIQEILNNKVLKETIKQPEKVKNQWILVRKNQYILHFRVFFLLILIALVRFQFFRCWLGQVDAWCTSARIRFVVKENTAVYVLQTKLRFLYWKLDIVRSLHINASFHHLRRITRIIHLLVTLLNKTSKEASPN